MIVTVRRHGLGGLEIGDLYSIHSECVEWHHCRYIQIEHDRPMVTGPYTRGMRYGYIGDPGWPVGTIFTVTALTKDAVTIEHDPALQLPEGL